MQLRHCSYESIHFMHWRAIAIATIQQHWQSLSCQRCERSWVSLQRRSTTWYHHLHLCKTCWHTHVNCMHAKQIIILFYICFYRTIIFFYNYLRQMYQIIHLSLERRLSPARGKNVQKNSEVKRTSCNVVRLLCTHAHTLHALEAIYRYII